MIEPTLVGWCDECEAYETPFAPGMICGGDHGEGPSGNIRPRGFRKRLRRRRMYICLRNECDFLGFFEESEYIRHVEDHADTDWMDAEDDDMYAHAVYEAAAIRGE